MNGPWLLDRKDFKMCGLSNAKCKTIFEFSEEYISSPEIFDKWQTLCYGELENEISEFLGMSIWTAKILAISYYGFEDVFPENDGSLKRAISHIENNYSSNLENGTFNPNLAKPCRTYLALYLWMTIDSGALI